MEEITALIQQLDGARQAVATELAGIDQDQTICPGWTIKDLLAHLIGWDEVATAALRVYNLGQGPVTAPVPGIEYHNAQSVAMRKALSYNHMVKEWDLARDLLKAALLAVSSDKIDAPLLYPWGPTGTVRELVAIYAQHELEHAAELHELKAFESRPAEAR
jgi:uncharacterized protein (TIGR03083 family)